MKRIAVLAVMAAVLAGCGGGSGYGGPEAADPPPTAAATFTFGADGLSPKEVTIAPDATVTFINNSGRAIDVSSDPHPSHTDCPELNLGALASGSSRSVKIVTRATCRFHDHIDPTNESVRGVIRVSGY